MACLIPLQFRNSAHDLEQEFHPLRDTWFKSLAQLRDLCQDNPGVRTRDHDQQIAEYSYCCVEKERPRKVIYLYPQCLDKKFQRIKAELLSETSTLNRQLSPLLESPLDTKSILRLHEEIRLIHPGADSGPKCLEFITLYNPKRPIMLYPFLEPHWAGGSCAVLSHVPVRSFSTQTIQSPLGNKSLFCCIEWKNLEARAALYADSSLRKQMKTANAEHRAAVIQKLGKAEEDLTWEEDLQAFFESTGATNIQNRFLTGLWVNEAYSSLGQDTNRKRRHVWLCG